MVVGHSERREYHGETDATVAAKAKAAFDNGIVPIVCVGEGLDIRKAGDQVSYTLAQVEGSLAGIPAEQAKDVVIAYEPVWAIGTGEVATPPTLRKCAERSVASSPSCTAPSSQRAYASSTAVR